MNTQAEMKSMLQKYIDGFNNKDSDAIISLFADHAKIEDPVGGQPIQGKDNISAFYQKGVSMVKSLELAAPIRGSHGNSAAVAFIINMDLDGKAVQIHAIDVMTFNDACQIIDMKAYWGPEDIIEL